MNNHRTVSDSNRCRLRNVAVDPRLETGPYIGPWIPLRNPQVAYILCFVYFRGRQDWYFPLPVLLPSLLLSLFSLGLYISPVELLAN